MKESQKSKVGTMTVMSCLIFQFRDAFTLASMKTINQWSKNRIEMSNGAVEEQRKSRLSKRRKTIIVY